MAEIDSIDKVIARIRHMPEAMADRAVGLMKYYITISTHGTGELAASVRKGKYADGTFYVETHKYTKGPYGIREVGAIISKGRPGLKPRPDLNPRKGRYSSKDPERARLRWFDPSGDVHYAKEVGPAEPNDFLDKTVEHLEGEIQSIWDHL